MIDNDDVTLTPEQKVRLRLAIRRMQANLLGFPALCAKAACRRARKCSGNPAVCMDDIGSDVPHDVRDAVDELLFGKFAGRPFDEMLAEAPDKIEAWCGWLEKVKTSAVKLDVIRRPKAKKTPDGLSTS
jgi:broad specificity phosphatase PhoE